MIDYMIYVRLIIGVGLLLAGGVSVMLDHSPTQILFSTLAIAVGIMFIVLGLRPEEVNKIEKEIEGMNKVEEFDHSLEERLSKKQEETNEIIKELNEEYSKQKDDPNLKEQNEGGFTYSNEIGKGGKK